MSSRPTKTNNSESGGNKRRRNRGNRRKMTNFQETNSEQPTSSALEVGCFFSNDEQQRDPDDVKEKIPPPLPVEVFSGGYKEDGISKLSNTKVKGLKRIWDHFCERRQKTKEKIEKNEGQSVWQPTPIQRQTWSILTPSETDASKVNLVGISPTASGKTLAYGAPLALTANSSTQINGTVCGIVLVPTRELAQQVAKELDLMISSFKNPHLRVLACYGGGFQTTKDLVELLSDTASSEFRWLISATPGRLLDIIEEFQKHHGESKSGIFQPEHIVMDEADRLAQNTDLQLQITSILKSCILPSSTTLSLFSATYPHKVQEIWKEWMALNQQKSCVMIRVDAVSLEASSAPVPKNKKARLEEPMQKDTNDNSSGGNDGGSCKNDESQSEKERDSMLQLGQEKDESVSEPVSNNYDFFSKIPAHLVQTLHVCAEHKKPRKLVTTLDKIRKEEKQHKYRQKRLGIIFFGRIKTLKYISNFLNKQSNHTCLELHSQLPQAVRNKNLKMFQAGRTPILLATDLASRGVHISNISFVVNYDFPANLEQYVHRCGRAGRKQPATTSATTNQLPPVVYSFFTRNLAPLARDLVSLLRASKAWVDPNLLALVTEGGAAERREDESKDSSTDKDVIAASAQSSVSLDKTADEKDSQKETDEDEAYSEDEDEFQELSAKRIVLQRASHVSDASSESSEEEDEN